MGVTGNHFARNEARVSKTEKLGTGWPESEKEQVGNVKLEEEVMKTTK